MNKKYPEIELEDLPPDEIVKVLQAIGKEVGRRAIAENKALGLPTTFLKDGLIIKEYADGKREILGTVPPGFKVIKGGIYETKTD